MTYATDTFTGDGSTTEFTLTFDFIQRSHVKVYRVVTATEAETELTVITSGDPSGDEFIWESDTQVKVGTAPTSDQQLKITRETPEDEQIVEWADGSYIIAQDLNTADRQFLYGIQELEDKFEELDGSVAGEAVKEVTGTAPVSVDSSDAQKPAISVDAISKAEAESDPTDPSWDTDDKLASAGAIDRVFKQVVGDGVGFPGSGNKAKDGQLRVDNTGDEPELYYWGAALGSPAWVQIATKGDKGDTGPEGPEGPTGPAPGLQDPAASASNVSLNTDGSLGTATATVSQDGDKNLKFEFGIPVGQKGDKGDTGSGVTYKGLIAAVTADEPTDPENGDFYVSSEAGTSSWAGEVQVGSRIVWNEATDEWDVYEPAASQTLQQVTDLGNFTTEDIAIGNESSDPRLELKGSDGSITAAGTIKTDSWFQSDRTDGNSYYLYGLLNDTETVGIKADGSITADGPVDITDGGIEASGNIENGYDASSSTAEGCQLEASGAVYVQRPADSTFSVFGGWKGTTRTSTIGSDGSATFEGRLEANQGSFNADVGIIGESGTDTAFFIRDAGDSDKTTFSVQADGDVEVEGDITAAGSADIGVDTVDYQEGIRLANETNGSQLTCYTDSAATKYPVLRVYDAQVAGVDTQIKAQIDNDGSITASNKISTGDPDTGDGVRLYPGGNVYVRNDTGSEFAYRTYSGSFDDDDVTFSVTGGGSIEAAGGATFKADTTVEANLLIKGGDGSGVFIRNKEDTEYTIDLNEDGSIDAKGDITIGDDPRSGDEGVYINSNGEIAATRPSANNVIAIRAEGSASTTAAIRGDGRVECKEIEFPDGTIQTTAASASSTCKAWANFDGDTGGVPSVNDSFNVDSITKEGTGHYKINFTDNMSDGNYVVSVSGCDTTESDPPTPLNYAVKYLTTTGFQIFVRKGTSSEDMDLITVAVFGN
jgi:hypothetical protein